MQPLNFIRILEIVEEGKSDRDKRRVNEKRRKLKHEFESSEFFLYYLSNFVLSFQCNKESGVLLIFIRFYVLFSFILFIRTKIFFFLFLIVSKIQMES